MKKEGQNDVVKTTVNFRQFKLFTDISQTDSRVLDVSRDFADLMYKNLNGIVAHDLALRIYRSTGEMELTQEEEMVLVEFAKQATPIFYDSLQENLKKKTI